MSELKQTDADEVFEFLDSLPETKKTDKNGDGKGKDVEKTDDKNDNDIMDFLDELEKSNLELNKKKLDTTKKETPRDDLVDEPLEFELSEIRKESDKGIENPVVANKEPIKRLEKKAPFKEEKSKQEQVDHKSESEEERDDTPLNDPITSISNWWSSSGSAAVSNMWSKTQEQASQIQKRIQEEQKQLPIKDLTALTSNINASTITDLANKLQEIVVGETEEVLRIHLVHDLVNYPLLQYHVEQRFYDILNSQVQGGIRIFVDEWTNPNDRKSGLNSDEVVAKTPQESRMRKLNIFQGKNVEGEKLAFANLDNAIKLFTKSREEIKKQQEDAKSENKKDQEETDGDNNISDIFISILAISPPGDNEKDSIKTTDGSQAGNFNFTVILKDITNSVTSITRSQGFPNKWASWLEGSYESKSKDDAILQAREKDEKKKEHNEEEDSSIDPSEWVMEWVEDGLSLTFGVAAQNYIIDRMGY